MKIALVVSRSNKSQEVKQALLTRLEQESVEIDEKHPEIVISIGGDGTLLKAFHQYTHRLSNVHFLAIHTGNLGFYTDFLDEELEDVVACLKEKTHQTYQYPLLRVNIVQSDKCISHMVLNEVTVKTLTGTLVCEVSIDDALFEIFRGDGLCVCTPTGSTGLNKSLGGALLHPKMEAMQLTEIAALNNRVYKTIGSPLILPKGESVRLIVKDAVSPFVVIDNIDPIHFETQDNVEITVSISEEHIHFINYKNIDFWMRTKNSFIGK
ncbi:NAD kinase [Carnobacteriaceae bacterium zg-ZUI78]|uniref:NAD kinase n=1 Tax=Granulicatella sp. zg-84 TaxID=2678503 RepID=UPI0013C24305|nr:NAD kinase [Granulicatella sp. zg-84]MBS4750715.1 NAD kinase [Carnobacteriaceae bacterium zg-ZUI78]NEW65962.1 NAD kinase [Granulicatella sp. zg-84]QMI85185.1 NAD kinase [Carnobacteriaceae bacterium zg-84]